MIQEGHQDPLFEINTSEEEIGYNAHIAAQLAHISYRQLDYWDRTKLVKPSIRGAAGSGSQRLYSFRDVLVLKIVKGLLDTGISLQKIREAVAKLHELSTDDLSGITLVSDGKSVYECREAEEVYDLLAGAQGMFGIGIPGLVKELSGTIMEFPVEFAQTTPKNHRNLTAQNSSMDELSLRRQRKNA